MQEKIMPPGNFSANLRAALDEAELTQAQLAERTGCTQPDISRYLSSDRIPSGDKLVSMARALGTTAEELINRQALPPGRAVAYNSLDVDGGEAGPMRYSGRRRNSAKRVKRFIAQAEEALKGLREELGEE